jgi:hypothetical protein
VAQSYVSSTPPRDSAPEELLGSRLELGGPRTRAFSGGVVTSAGVTLFFDYWGRGVLFVVAAAICVAIALFPVAPTHLWYSPFLTGLGLGLLMAATFLWFRPHVTGATGDWLIAVAVGSLLFWLLPGRHGRPVFLLTMLVAAMIGVAIRDAGATIDETDHVVRRFLDSIEPSVVTLIIFAVAYTLYGMALDGMRLEGGAGTFFVAAMIGAGWALIIAFGSSDRALLAAIALTGILLLIAGSIGGRRTVLHFGLLIFAVSVVRFLDAPALTNQVQRPDVPSTVYIGLVLILFGLVLGRGVHDD